ncbi:hypothetical protein N0V82_004754 [Gnomoniopsis sp. IMI 355080]|nr:hypothetical protein N0V82_004754 [Gnomoniopsis sp. IMI 355080]
MCPDTWTPLSGTLSALSTFASQVLISAIVSWASNKHFSFAGILGMWTLRPRSAFISLILVRAVGWSGFKATMFDIIVSESILDVIALPFALTLLLGAQNSDGKTCGLTGYHPDDQRLDLTHSSFGWSTAAGVLSSIVLAQFLIMSFNNPLYPEALAEKDEEGKWDKMEFGWKRYFFRHEKRQILPIILAMGTLISNWVLWSQFMSLQGNNYCEGTNGIATLTISILHQTLVPLLRACFGLNPDDYYDD